VFIDRARQFAQRFKVLPGIHITMIRKWHMDFEVGRVPVQAEA
jgi:hypothetical protein